MINEFHRHTGADSDPVNAADLMGPAVITAELAVSSRNVQPSILQRGSYTLAANVKFVSFPQPYSTTTNLQVVLTSKTTNPQFLDSMALSGFTVSGSGTDQGIFLSIGYK